VLRVKMATRARVGFATGSTLHGNSDSTCIGCNALAHLCVDGSNTLVPWLASTFHQLSLLWILTTLQFLLLSLQDYHVTHIRYSQIVTINMYGNRLPSSAAREQARQALQNRTSAPSNYPRSSRSVPNIREGQPIRISTPSHNRGPRRVRCKTCCSPVDGENVC
jgi:hypothetical protein